MCPRGEKNGETEIFIDENSSEARKKDNPTHTLLFSCSFLSFAQLVSTFSYDKLPCLK